MSATEVSRSRMAMANAREATRGWLNAVNLHWAGVAVLSLVIVYLLVQMGLAWQIARGEDAAALQQQRLQLHIAEVAARPLQGLDVKLADSSKEADRFYMERLPINYSEIATELGVLKAESKVRLNSVKYAQGSVATEPGAAKTTAPIPDGAGGKLTEVHLDASLTGDYRPLVQFINGLERDRVFFLVNNVMLTGQQGGTVSLRLRMTTYLRGVVTEDEQQKADAAAAEAPSSELDKAVEVQAARSQKSRKPAGAR